MHNNNDDTPNPYEILGVSQDTSDSEIRAAYRRLALRHHPDKQKTEAAKRTAHSKFAEISHAYELLTDKDKRRQYDRNYQQQQQPWNNNNAAFSAFHDPFQVFAQVFGQEFGHPSHHGPHYPSNTFGASGMMQQDPFFSESGPLGGPFFRGGGGSMFGDVFSDMRRSMFEQMQQHQQQSGGGIPPTDGNSRPPQHYFSSYSSSSTSTSIGPQGHTRQTTTTRTVNGKQQTTTERVTTKPDGTIERHVETTGDNNVDDVPPRRLRDANTHDVVARRFFQHPVEGGTMDESFRQASRRNHHQQQQQDDENEADVHRPPRKLPFGSTRRSKKNDNDHKRDGDDSNNGNRPPQSKY